jgi:hypothetical protein
MDRAAAGQADRRRERRVEQRAEVNRPFGLRQVRHRRGGKAGADFGNGRRLVDKDAFDRRHDAGQRRGKRRRRVETRRRAELPGMRGDIVEPPAQRRRLGDNCFDRRRLADSQPDRTLTTWPLALLPGLDSGIRGSLPLPGCAKRAGGRGVRDGIHQLRAVLR